MARFSHQKTFKAQSAENIAPGIIAYTTAAHGGNFLNRTGSYMAIQGVSTTIIGKALGHRSQASTAPYARLTQDPVRQAMINAQAVWGRMQKDFPISEHQANTPDTAAS